MNATLQAAWLPPARRAKFSASSTRSRYRGSSAACSRREGLVVASCGRCSAIASMSPVSATTVVERFNDSRRFMALPRVGSNPGKPQLSGVAGSAGPGPAVGRQVLQKQADCLGCVGHACWWGELFGGLWGCGKGCEHLALQGQDRGGRLLAGFDAGLVIAVDANQAGVETHRALEEGDQPAHGPGIDARDRDGHGLAVVLEQGRSRAEQKAVQVVAGRDARLHLARGTARFQNADEGDEEVVHAVA